MLTQVELLSLSHLLRDERVLSVYVDGSGHDPAQQHAWRVELANALKAVRRSLEGSSHDERVAFDACVTSVDERLAQLGDGVGAPGWVAFVTRNGVHYADAIPAPTPTLALWTTGISLTPYLRALKQTRPIAAVVVDARKARIYEYRAGTLRHVETIHAHAVTEPPSHMGNPPSQGFHGGTRGATGHDAAQHTLTEGTARMIEDVASKAIALAGPDGWIVTGGIPHVARQLTHSVEHLAKGRVLQLESLDIHASDAEIADAAQESASTLRDAADLQDVSAVIAETERIGAASLGLESTRYALEQSCVRELYVTERYVRDHTTDAEDAVRVALAQGAVVEEVTRGVGSRLDEYGGIGARLRYVLTKPGASATAGL